MKLKFTGQLQMASLSLYPQSETNLMSNCNVTEHLLQLKSKKAHGKNYTKVKAHLVRHLLRNRLLHHDRLMVFTENLHIQALTLLCLVPYLLVPSTENHLSSFKCGFLNIFSRQNLLRSLSSLLFLLRWNKNGAKKYLKNHSPFDF